jgi:hypothetical protein
MVIANRIIDMSLDNQVNVKWNMYFNSWYVAYLFEFTFCYCVHVMKQPVLKRLAYCCLSLSIEDEWYLQCDHLVQGYLLPHNNV